jgi:cytochrome d ubiquinol oxidase subunit I
MVGIGTTLILLGATFWVIHRGRRGKPLPRRLLQAVALATPLGFVAIEAGWTVTEVGRQPWVVYGVMRTRDGVTEVPGQFAAFGGFTATYVVLALATAWLLLRLGRTPPSIEPETDPAGSRPSRREEARHVPA